jgi:LemA protein
MKSSVGVLAALVAVVVAVGLWFASANNRFVGQDERVRQAWSQVENNYQRRADLVPNLVATVKGVAGFEKEAYAAVAQARAKAVQLNVGSDVLADPEKFARFEAAQRELSQGLGRLLATAEAYPDLKASQSFRDLQAQLEGTENRISVERRRFNDAVAEYNVSVKQFPGRFAAGFLGFHEKPYFRSEGGAERAPKVQF